MERWEYQVIHLNVETPVPAPPPPPGSAAPAVEPGGGTPPVRVEPVFSEEYLKQEFPDFYGTPPPVGAPAQVHPADQLRGFLNVQGGQGWQLIGFYPVGQLQMMIFRRPLAAAASGQSVALEPPPQVGEVSPAPAAPRSEIPPPGDATAALQAAALERILARLEALERRLPPLPTATAPPGAREGPQDGEILPPQRWAELDDQPRLSTQEAARALGFRSAASLLNLAARHGYPQGLVKRGLEDAVAVYVGCEKSGRGGRDRRLWVVLRAGSG